MAWSLGDVLGQDDLLSRLASEARHGRTAHATMLEGSWGTGKCTVARGLAARYLCANPGPDGIACGVCRPCHMLTTGNHPDYLELPREPAELRLGRFVERTAASASTDRIDHTPLIPFLRLKPVEGDIRVAVIPDADRMRQESANAFLKTLEEPPGNAVIILTVSARDRLPATIASRCRRFGLAPLPAAAIAEQLEKRGILSGSAAAEVAAAAEGSLGTAIELAQGQAMELWRWLDNEAFRQPGAEAALRLADELIAFGSGETGTAGAGAAKRKNALKALDLTALALRRLLRRGSDPTPISRALAVLWTAAEQVVRNVRPDLALTSAAFEAMAILRR